MTPLTPDINPAPKGKNHGEAAMSEQMQKMLDMMPLPAGEPITGKTYLADGWVYRDLPRLSHSAFDRLVSIIGDENIVWLTQADYGDSKRGQLLLSPDGIRRLRAHRASASTPPKPSSEPTP